MAIGNIGSSLVAVAGRPITADDLKNVKPGVLGQGKPMKPQDVGTGKTGASSLLSPLTDEQKAAAKAEDKQQQAFARMKVEMRAKNGVEA
ncbi:hypothetical protein [Pseudomonas sp.]|uniref:hypothetical protein n=1 Tax=Pseudomonas sp. TaxID=306 RepID=UPI0026097151|nr:hypothetical protein [Pseudomonas sp.]